MENNSSPRREEGGVRRAFRSQQWPQERPRAAARGVLWAGPEKRETLPW